MMCLFNPFSEVVEAECDTAAGDLPPICCLYPDIVWFVSWLFSSLFFIPFQHYVLKVTLVIAVFCWFFFFRLLSLVEGKEVVLLVCLSSHAVNFYALSYFIHVWQWAESLKDTQYLQTTWKQVPGYSKEDTVTSVFFGTENWDSWALLPLPSMCWKEKGRRNDRGPPRRVFGI